MSLNSNALVQKIWENLKAQKLLNQNTKRLVVAYSGGKDSHALLHALSELRYRYLFEIEAWHVHHGLSPHADNWLSHCKSECKKLNVPFASFKAQLKLNPAESVEEQAREARYKIFKQHLTKSHVLLTAHSKNDQAETLMINLLRGTGLMGLSAMKGVRTLGHSKLIRPFLDVSQFEIDSYAKHNQLNWIEDESNQDSRFLRNSIRHQVMPILSQLNTKAVDNLVRCAKHCHDSQDLLDNYLLQEVEKIQHPCGALSVQALHNLSISKQNEIIRYCIRERGLKLPSEKKLEDIRQQMLYAGKDTQPKVQWGNSEIRRHQDKIYIFNQRQSVNVSQTLTQRKTWNLKLPLNAKNCEWQARRVQGEGLSENIIGEQLVVGFRHYGGKSQIMGESFNRKIKHIFQSLHIPPWERHDIPLLYFNEQLVAVGQHVISKTAAVQSQTDYGWVIQKS